MRAKEPAVFTLPGGIAFTGGLVLGVTGANIIHRACVTVSATNTTFKLPAGVPDIATYNNLAVDAKLTSWSSIGLQALLGVAGVVGGVYLPWNAAKLISYGIGFGALGHLTFQLVDGYILEPMFKTGATGTQWYAHEMKANNALYPATTTTTTGTPAAGTGSGMTGSPVVSRRGTPVAAAAPGQMHGRVPHALASMMGMAAVAPSALTAAGAMLANPVVGAAGVPGRGTTLSPDPVSVMVANTPVPSNPTQGLSNVAPPPPTRNQDLPPPQTTTAGPNAPSQVAAATTSCGSTSKKVGCGCTSCNIAASLGEPPPEDQPHPMIAARYARTTPRFVNPKKRAA